MDHRSSATAALAALCSRAGLGTNPSDPPLIHNPQPPCNNNTTTQGRNVVLESKYGSPKIVNDGVTIAREVRQRRSRRRSARQRRGWAALLLWGQSNAPAAPLRSCA